MAQDRKQLLIVDDAEIDRMILKSILSSEFVVTEVDSGTEAFQYITLHKDHLDAILMDIAMPNINGFDVLRLMRDKGIVDIPVFLITGEPTRENVEMAFEFGVAEFIGKPLDQEDILRRLRARLGVLPVYDPKKDSMQEVEKYIADLEAFYKIYLANYGKNDEHYRARSDIMQILLTHYNRNSRGVRLEDDAVKLISKAAYFCDIGEILVPDKRLQMLNANVDVQALQGNHTEYGSNLIRLNRSEKCSFFVEVCASMCMHHPERFDGNGYPNHIVGKSNSIYNQLCRLVDEFELRRSKFYGDRAKPVSFVIKRLINDDKGMVSPELFSILEDCEKQIYNYFIK